MPTYELLRQDPQIAGRGGLPYRMLHPYRWDNIEECGSFRLLCDEFDKLLPFERKSGLANRDIAYRLYRASEGNVGRLKGYIDAAAYCAINDDSACVELKHFAQAYDERKEPGERFNWFRDDPKHAPAPRQESKLRVKSGPASHVFSKKSERELY